MAKEWGDAYYPELHGQGNFSAGKIRVEYLEQGAPAEMGVYAIVGAWTTPINGVSMTFWGADSVLYSRAQKGRLDDQYKLFQAVQYSEKMNIQWMNQYAQIRSMMIQNQIEASNRAVSRAGIFRA